MYLLDVADQALSFLTDSSDIAEFTELTDLSFTPDSKIILVAVETCHGSSLEVHVRDRPEYLLQFHPPLCNMAVACLDNTRAAIASRSAGITVCDLLSGTQISSVGQLEVGLHFVFGELIMPPPSSPCLLSTDPTGSRLAYLAADSTELQIFDAVTLRQLGSFGLPAPFLPSESRVCSLDLGMHSCVLHTRLGRGSVATAFVCRLDAGSQLLSEPLRIESTQAPALSKFEAFAACVSKSKPSTVQVYNVYSGAMVLAHELTLPAGYDGLAPLEVAWIQGSKLLITTNATRTKSQKSTDHILVLHL